MNNDKRVGTGVDEISQLLKNGKFVSLSRLNENFQSKLDALKVTFPSLEVKECAHGLSVELFDPESHKVSDESESSLKNHYGDNVAWFCYEASLIDADFQHDDLIPDVLEIICDNGGSIDVDVRNLFESAHVVIEEKDVRIKQLEEALRNALAITTDSTGVAGYHLNGEVVAWDEFEEIEVAQSLLEANVGKIEYPESEQE
ncbi:hypothetical protein ACWONS_003494 [Vibrio parahaemolyticus]